MYVMVNPASSFALCELLVLAEKIAFNLRVKIRAGSNNYKEMDNMI